MADQKKSSGKSSAATTMSKSPDPKERSKAASELSSGSKKSNTKK